MAEIHQWQTIGHEAGKRILDKQLLSGRLAHAYIFLGLEGIGKRTLAEEFAAKILGGVGSNLVRLDFRAAGMAELRQTVNRLALRPSTGERQVAIFDAAEEMSPATSNALLKTLEEPTTGTVLILIASRASLPRTILSRCRVLHFGKLAASDILAVAKRQGLEVQPELAAASAGRVSQYVSMVGGERASEVIGWKQDWQTLLDVSVFDRLLMVQEWAGDESDNLIRRIEFWLSAIPSSNSPAARLAAHTQVLLEAWSRLNKNANKKMVLEYICLSL